MSEAKISSRSARDENGLAVTCPASRHAEQIAEELIEHGSCGQLADEGKHAGQSIFSAVRSLYAARAEIARLVAEVERHRMTEKKLKLYVWHGFEPGWSGGLAFALAYTKGEAMAAVEKVWRAKVNEWGRLRVHRVDAGRAEAMAGGG